MTANRIFYNFLQIAYPSISKSFKKRRNSKIYETFPKLKEIGHKFIYDVNQQLITHLYYKPINLGFGYEKEFVSETVKVHVTDDGFRTVRI